MNPMLLALAVVCCMQLAPELIPGQNRQPERPRLLVETDADSLVPSTGAGTPVVVEILEGMPATERERRAFLAGFGGALQERELALERVAKNGEVKPGRTIHNPLRLVEGREDARWTVRLRLTWRAAPDSAASEADSLVRAWVGRIARLAIQVERAEEARPAAPLPPRTEWLRFPAGHPMDAAYQQHVGRQVGLVVIETVCRATGELADDQRLVLEDTRCAPPAEGR